MNPYKHVNYFLFLLPGIYRIGAFIAIYSTIYGVNKNLGLGLSHDQSRLLIFALFAVIGYFFLVFRPRFLIILLVLEYFVFFIFHYRERHDLAIELIWLPSIIVSFGLILRSQVRFALIFLIGLAGPFIFSYGFVYRSGITIDNVYFSFMSAALLIYISSTVIAVLLNIIITNIEKIQNDLLSFQSDNTNLNEINRAISQRIFKIQNDVAKKERDRLSKEIHDKAGYIFINLIMMLQAASSLIHKDLEKTEKLIKDARNYAERGINEIRYLLRGIRSFSPVKMSLQNELYDLAVSFHEATEVEIEMDYGGWPKTISENIDSFFISFMQESLTNALKHGKATKVSCCCWTDETHMGMSITDNGIGTKEPIYKGIGIAAMEDVADQAEGFIKIITNDRDGGFKITAAISRKFSGESGSE